MIRLAKQYGCYGYRKVTALLRIEGWRVNRNVVSIDNWRSVFLKMRIDSGAKEESVKKDFTRQSERLQESGIVHCYNAEVWIIHEEDRQDI